MDKPLFENVGKELKEIAQFNYKWAKAPYILGGIALTAAGIGVASTNSEMGWCALVGIVIAIFLFLYGSIKARQQVILLYAYGELVEKVTSLDEKIAPKGGGKKTKKKKDEDNGGQEAIDIPCTRKNSDGTWQCIFCDHKNPAGADWCEECGMEASFE